MTNIVTVNVSQQVAPTPSQLQQTGALISQGGTTTAQGTLTLLTQASSYTAVKTLPLANTSLSWLSSVVTVTTAAPHGLTSSDTLQITIAGVTPSGYNGTFTATVTGASTFTYPLVSNPGSETVPGTWIVENVSELQAMVTTFFAQGPQQAVYILELGPGNQSDGVTYLTTWLTANPNTLYAVLLPRAWGQNSISASGFAALIASYEATTSKFYFFVTTNNSIYTSFTALMKNVVAEIEAPSGLPATEFSLAAGFWNVLHQAPSTTNKVPPFAFQFQFGVTPYPTAGNSALLSTYETANVNVVGTGAEGGISNALWAYGTTMDGNDFLYWYAVDWMQINADEAIANAIINGSNNPLAPLYYNQQGINQLQQVLGSTAASGVTFGLVLGQVVFTQLDGPVLAQAIFNNQFPNLTVVNAVPFITYSGENPGDYKIGKYSGLSVTFTPTRGFRAITLNIVVTQFVVP